MRGGPVATALLLCAGLLSAPALAARVNRVPAATAAEVPSGPSPPETPATPGTASFVQQAVVVPQAAVPAVQAAPAVQVAPAVQGAPAVPVVATTTAVHRHPARRAAPPVERTQAVRRTETGASSWYPGKKDQCAHRTIALMTVVTVINVANGRSTRCTVTNRGPTQAGRIIDLTKPSFAELASPAVGLVEVRIEW